MPNSSNSDIPADSVEQDTTSTVPLTLDNMQKLGSVVARSASRQMVSNELTESQEQQFQILRDNTFGIIDSDGTIEEKRTRLLNLLPMAFEVVDEARETIRRLRDRVEELESGQDKVTTPQALPLLQEAPGSDEGSHRTES